jgi:predicted N-acyltransferase
VDVEVVDRIANVPAEAWDACVASWDPFAEHRFLALLEEAGAVGTRQGWQPCHLVVREAGSVVGAMPLYLKDHSYGEYIFDWGWAAAAERARIAYYPKIVSQVPFTPATGRRFLVRDGRVEGPVVDALVAGMRAVGEGIGCSSLHVLFCTAAEWSAVQGREGFIARTTHQFHWENEGYESFEQYLGTYRSKDRKKARRERDKVAELGVAVQLVRGGVIDDAQWKAIETFYRDTIARHGGHPYLGRKWFQLARERLGDRILAVVASRNGKTVAASLCLQRGDRLYGRYWGSEPRYSALHFELCYHRPIEACIENGWARFEAGAQGSHKLKRGLRPHPTYSLHWIRHPGLRAAIADAMVRETEMVERDMELLDAHAPFRKG